MEYAQIMMSCGLLVCPADESDVERAEKTNTLVTLSNKHSKNCPNHQKAKSDDPIHGEFCNLQAIGLSIFLNSDITNKVMIFNSTDSKPKSVVKKSNKALPNGKPASDICYIKP